MVGNIKLEFQKVITNGNNDIQGCIENVVRERYGESVMEFWTKQKAKNESGRAIDITTFNNMNHIYQEIRNTCGATNTLLNVEYEMTRLSKQVPIYTNKTYKYAIGNTKKGLAFLSLPPFAIEYKVWQVMI